MKLKSAGLQQYNRCETQFFSAAVLIEESADFI
jgi:hypothetical protein